MFSRDLTQHSTAAALPLSIVFIFIFCQPIREEDDIKAYFSGRLLRLRWRKHVKQVVDARNGALVAAVIRRWSPATR